MMNKRIGKPFRASACTVVVLIGACLLHEAWCKSDGIPPCNIDFEDTNIASAGPDDVEKKLERIERWNSNAMIGDRSVKELLQYRNIACDLKDPDLLVSKYASCRDGNRVITNQGILTFVTSKIAGRKQSCVKHILPIINDINKYLPDEQRKLFTTSEPVKGVRLYEGASAIGPAAQTLLGQWFRGSDWEKCKKQAHQACLDYETTWSNLIIRKNLEGLADSDPTIRHWWNVELICGHLRFRYGSFMQPARKSDGRKSDKRQSASRQSVNEQSDRSGFMACDENFDYFNFWGLTTEIAENKLEELREQNPWIGNRRVDELLQYKNTNCDMKDPGLLKSEYATCKQGDSYITNQGIINFIASKVAGRKQSCLEVIPPIVKRAIATLSVDNYLRLRKIFIQDERTFYQGSSDIRKAVNNAYPPRRYGGQTQHLREACAEYESINSKLEVARENLWALADYNPTIRRWWNLEFICNHINSA